MTNPHHSPAWRKRHGFDSIDPKPCSKKCRKRLPGNPKQYGNRKPDGIPSEGLSISGLIDRELGL